MFTNEIFINGYFNIYAMHNGTNSISLTFLKIMYNEAEVFLAAKLNMNQNIFDKKAAIRPRFFEVSKGDENIQYFPFTMSCLPTNFGGLDFIVAFVGKNGQKINIADAHIKQEDLLFVIDDDGLDYEEIKSKLKKKKNTLFHDLRPQLNYKFRIINFFPEGITMRINLSRDEEQMEIENLINSIYTEFNQTSESGEAYLGVVHYYGIKQINKNSLIYFTDLCSAPISLFKLLLLELNKFVSVKMVTLE